MLQLPPPVNLLDEVARIAPARMHLHEQLQEDFRGQQALDLQPRVGPDFLQIGALLADQDRLLSLAFAVDGRRNARQLGAFLILIDQYGCGVGNFLRGVLKHLLANQLRHQEAFGLIGNLVLGEIARAFRQRFDDHVEQGVEPLFLQRRDGNDIDELVQLFVLRNKRQQPFLGDQVDFVEQQNDGNVGLLREIQDELVAFVELAGSIDDHQQQVASLERVVNLFHHAAVEGVDRLVHARRIDQDELPGGPLTFLLDVDDALNAVARSLRLAGDDGQFFANERIEKG